tara:strand:- start:462586 stop:463326 length:741 start_codon:yes stop_codon:yes gene_type:complete
MKKVIILSLGLVLLVSNKLYSQQKDRIIHLENFDKRKLHFGYYLGLNQKGYSIKYNDKNLLVNDLNTDYIVVEESIGFNIGLVVDYKLHDNINLRFEPGLSSNTKKVIFDSSVVGENGINGAGNERDVPATYLRLPLLLKFSTNRLDNMRAYLIGGVSYDYNFSSNQNNVDDNTQGQFRMKTSNFMYEVGVGVDIYLQWFKFSPSVRGIFAINNELVPDDTIPNSPYTYPIDYFGTRGIFINFTFE